MVSETGLTGARLPTGYVGRLALLILLLYNACFRHSGNMTLFHIRQRISNGNMMLATQTGNLREGKLFLVKKKVLVYFK